MTAFDRGANNATRAGPLTDEMSLALPGSAWPGRRASLYEGMIGDASAMLWGPLFCSMGKSRMAVAHGGMPVSARRLKMPGQGNTTDFETGTGLPVRILMLGEPEDSPIVTLKQRDSLGRL